MSAAIPAAPPLPPAPALKPPEAAGAVGALAGTDSSNPPDAARASLRKLEDASTFPSGRVEVPASGVTSVGEPENVIPAGDTNGERSTGMASVGIVATDALPESIAPTGEVGT